MSGCLIGLRFCFSYSTKKLLIFVFFDFRIRSQLSSSVTETFAVKPLAEETYCLQVLANVESWIQSVKRVVQVPKSTKLFVSYYLATIL